MAAFVKTIFWILLFLDEGDVDSDQLSDIARTMVMQTIRDEIGKQVM